MTQYFEILELETTATAQEVQDAYTKLSSKYNPDKFKNDTEKQKEAVNYLKKINQARAFLKSKLLGASAVPENIEPSSELRKELEKIKTETKKALDELRKITTHRAHELAKQFNDPTYL